MIENLTYKTFNEKVANIESAEQWKLLSDIPCIIDFYADWCQPCKLMSPILEDFAKQYEGKINFYKINVEEEQDLGADFGIKSIPAFLFCPTDSNPEFVIGAIKPENFTKYIEEIFNM